MKKIYLTLLCILLVLAMGVGVLSIVDTDVTVSVSENREIKKPAFTWAGLLDGTYIPELESYYSDTFPGREKLLGANRLLNRFYYFSGSDEENMLIIDANTGAEQGGQSLDAVQAMQAELSVGQTPAVSPEAAVPAVSPEVIEEPEPEEAEPMEEEPIPEEEPVPEEKPDPELNAPDEGDASYAGSVVIVGTRAMEIPTMVESAIDDYAKAINDLSSAMGDSVRTISLLTPNGGEFYSPESLHTGLHCQKDMIDRCYGGMDDTILQVDAYAALRRHVDEYLFFRTDHHWTQLGAYYAYQALCETAGFDAIPLEDFETGRYENFVGSMYTFTSGYPQSQTLKDNPDYLDYYLPTVETHAKYYADASLDGGVPVSVVYTGIKEDFLNKYLCFIGGDTPICVIDTAAEGGVCLVLKESYGNALVPFLTSHYSRIITIDPREFNRDGKPSLDLKSFVKEQGVDDLLVVNYPYMINSGSYVSWLERLIGNE